MKQKTNYLKFFKYRLNAFLAGLILIALSGYCCITGEKETSEKYLEANISENDFCNVPQVDKPWVYYWWLKGNVTKELIARDLREMQKIGIGGFLLLDSRGYYDDYYGKTGHIPVPLDIKYEFMSPGWREMVKFTMQEANRLGLKMSINLANTGGSLRGPWNMKEDGPKQLIWADTTILGPKKNSIQLEKPFDKKYFKDVALMAVEIKSDVKSLGKSAGLNLNWNTVSIPAENANIAGEIIDLSNKITNGELNWEIPEGNWRLLRFGHHVIGDEGSVDIFNAEAVTKYFNLMGAEILKDAGPLAGKTLTYFYNVSWEGSQPDWTVNFKKEFKKNRGYDISQFMPILAGMSKADRSINERFLRDYFRTISDCFKHNCYETIGELCHSNGMQWHSENGGPWPRNASMFKEADQLTFWGINDMPQGEFWCNSINDLQQRSNVKYAANAAHIYGRPLVSVEAFTHMTKHWTMYPSYLKPFADINFIDGANFFIWHTFTASPLEVGKPGYEYFAGTHINPNVTWFNKAGDFFKYLGRCQYMLRKGKYVADYCCYVSDKNYVSWGRGKKWTADSSLTPVKGTSYDLLNSEVLTDRLSVEDGKLVLPDGVGYSLLVIDLDEPVIPIRVLQKINELVKDGATLVLGKMVPTRATGLDNYQENDIEVKRLAEELWGNNSDQRQIRSLKKGKVYTGYNLEEVLSDLNIHADFEGPFEYIHRKLDIKDVYFVSGEGKAECTFRVEGMKPEIWNPVTGQIIDAISYYYTKDGRTIIPMDLPENGSVFVVFREKADKNHFVSIDGPEYPEFTEKKEDSTEFIFWESGNYNLKTTNGNSKKLSIRVDPSLELTSAWNITFLPATGVQSFDASFDKLTLWNDNSDPQIKYFSGTAIYKNIFNLNEDQVKKPANLKLGTVHNISRVWINGKDKGIVWTAPWSVDITGALKEGENELKIEVTNCWANRLIGDAGLPENKWTTQTNVHRVLDRSKYKSGHQAFAATDMLMPSGLVGPVQIKFGEKRSVSLNKASL